MTDEEFDLDVAAQRDDVALKTGRCGFCGHQLLVSQAQCPECGKNDDEMAARQRARDRWLVRVIVICWVCMGLFALAALTDWMRERYFPVHGWFTLGLYGSPTFVVFLVLVGGTLAWRGMLRKTAMLWLLGTSVVILVAGFFLLMLALAVAQAI